MEGKQKINCTVTTCKYNNQENKKCILEAIQVAQWSQMNQCVQVMNIIMRSKINE